MSDLSNNYEVKRAILTRLGGNPDEYKNIYELELAILEKTAGGPAVDAYTKAEIDDMIGDLEDITNEILGE